MTSNRTIGVCIDGSDSSTTAFQWALDHLYRKDDSFVLIHVYEYRASATPRVSDPLKTSDAYKKEKDRIDKLTLSKVEALKKAGKKGKVISKQVIDGVGEDIVKIVKDESVEMLVVGTRGLNTMKRVLLGSVSDYLVKHANCPVIVIRDKNHSL